MPMLIAVEPKLHVRPRILQIGMPPVALESGRREGTARDKEYLGLVEARRDGDLTAPSQLAADLLAKVNPPVGAVDTDPTARQDAAPAAGRDPKVGLKPR